VFMLDEPGPFPVRHPLSSVGLANASGSLV
jgi:hypothetical protein